MYPLANYKRLKRTYTFGVPTFYNTFHLGVDLIVPVGTEVRAPFDGWAKKDDDDPNDDLGNCVYFQFGDLVMRCAHLSKFGQLGEVKKGTLIGLSGNTGKSTAPHVHLDLSRAPFNVNDRSRFIDPDKFDWREENTMTKEELKGILFDVYGNVWPKTHPGATPSVESLARDAEEAAERRLGGEQYAMNRKIDEWWGDYQVGVKGIADRLDDCVEQRHIEEAELLNAREDAGNYKRQLDQITVVYDQLKRESSGVVIENAGLQKRVTDLEAALKESKNVKPSTMTPLEKIGSGLVELLGSIFRKGR